MPDDAVVTVIMGLGPDAGEIAVTVPTGTPAGGVWGALPQTLAAGGPPDGVRYLLNGMRTLPGAPLRHGDRLEIAPPVEESHP